MVVGVGRVCLSLFRDRFSLAIQMALAMPRWDQSISLPMTVTASRAKAVIMGTHMFTDQGTPHLMFFESFTQWALCLEISFGLQVSSLKLMAYES